MGHEFPRGLDFATATLPRSIGSVCARRILKHSPMPGDISLPGFSTVIRRRVMAPSIGAVRRACFAGDDQRHAPARLVDIRDTKQNGPPQGDAAGRGTAPGRGANHVPNFERKTVQYAGSPICCRTSPKPNVTVVPGKCLSSWMVPSQRLSGHGGQANRPPAATAAPGSGSSAMRTSGAKRPGPVSVLPRFCTPRICASLGPGAARPVAVEGSTPRRAGGRRPPRGAHLGQIGNAGTYSPPTALLWRWRHHFHQR